MEIIKAEISGFGKWRQTEFDFVKGNQLFFGLNEDGKSTLYQFIIVMLFGFPNKGKRRRSYEPLDGTSFGGRLWLNHPVYGQLVVERFRGKNRGKATVFKDGSRFDENFLAKVLSPLTEETFRRVFTLNQEQLSDLAQLQEGELHDALTSLGAVGSTEIFQTRQHFDNQAQTIYKRRGLRQPLNEKLRQLQQLQKRVREKQGQEESFGQLIRQREAVQRELNELQQTIHQLNEENAVFAQQAAHWPQYEEWQRLQKLQPQVSDEELTFLNEVYQKYQQQARHIEELTEQRAVAQNTSQLGNDFYFYLEHEEQLQQILDQKAQLQLISERLNTQVAPEDLELLDKYQELWGWSPQFPPTPLSEAERNDFQARYQDLINQEQQLTIRLQLADEQRAMLDDELEILESQGDFQRPTKRKNQRLPLSLGVVGFVILLLSWLFLPGAAKIIGLLLGLAGIASAGYSFFAGQKNQPVLNSQDRQRKRWQEKLVQLDQVQGTIYQYEQEITAIQKEYQQLQQRFSSVVRSHHLGQLDLENLTTGLQELNYYLRVFGEYQQQQAITQSAQAEAAQFQKSIQFLTPWLALQGLSVNEAIQAIQDFVAKMNQLKEAQSQQQILFIQQNFLQQTKLQRESLAQLQPFMARFQLSQPSELVALMETENKIRQGKDQLAELAPIIQQYFPMELTKAEFDYGQEALQKELKKANQKYQDQLKKEQQLAAQINQMEQDGTLDELYAQLASVETEVQQLAVAWSKFKIAENILGDLSTELSNIQLPALLKKASQFIEILTEGRYQSLEYQEDLKLRQKNQLFSIFELSTGTKDQVMMAIRFGFLALEKNQRLAPIMIDDGWLHYDYLRKKQLAKLLVEFGKEQQIICFSSDREMLSYYQKFQQPVKHLGGKTLEKN